MANFAFKRGCRGTLYVTAADFNAVKALYGANCVQLWTN